MELNLLDDGKDPGRVMAVMYFPNNDEVRRQFLVRQLVKQACEDGGADAEVSIKASMLRELIEGPGLGEMKSLVEEAVRRGSVAGDLLHLVYEMHARGLQEPSFGKAIEEYKRFALGGKYGDGVPLKISEHMLRTYFNEYASVAHLWAAYRLNHGPYAYAGHPQDVFGSQPMLRRFLGVAKAVGEFACTFAPKRTKPPKPVIDPAEILRLPDDIAPLNLIFRPAS
jgi:hypothetical protein